MIYMNNHTFLQKENVDMLWDVIVDEDVFQRSPKGTVVSVYEVFCNNIGSFFDVEKKNATSLVDMNKKYIMLMLNFIRTTVVQQTQTHTQLQPTGNVARTKEPITRDDIQKDKKSQIEKDFDLRQRDFANAMTKPVPPVPKFNDEIDEPLGEMEQAIKIMTEQRKYDTDQINKGYTDSNGDWLKPRETSIKNEKFQLPPQQQLPPQRQEQQPQPYRSPPQQPSIKYIKIDNVDVDDNRNYIIDLLPPPQKHITWSDEQPQPFEGVGALFNKLKKIDPPATTIASQDDSIIKALEYKIEMLNEKVEMLNNNIKSILDKFSNKKNDLFLLEDR